MRRFFAPAWLSVAGPSEAHLGQLCVFIIAVPITKLLAWGRGRVGDKCYEIRRAEWEPKGNPVLEHRVRLLSLVPLVWESNLKLKGGWCK